MTGRMKTTAALLGGAALVATGAYALGAQAGDGSAQAAKARAGAADAAGLRAVHADRSRDRFEPFAGLASKLGVSQTELDKALAELRTDGFKEDRKEAFAPDLAKALGIDAAAVTAALEKVRKQDETERGARSDAFAAAVAKELGRSTADVKAAFEKGRPDDPPEPPGEPDERGFGAGPPGAGGPGEARSHARRFGPPLGAIAKDLGVSTKELSDALMNARGAAGPPKDEQHGEPDADLASALGVSQDKVDSAFKKLAEQKRAEFAKALADKLGIDVSKVKDALPGDSDGPRGERHFS